MSASGVSKIDEASSQLRKLLETGPTESQVLRFLKSNITLVRRALNVHAWNFVRVSSEFPLGRDYRVDFLILSADSARWHAVLIEMEDPTERLFLKDGTQSKPLRKGLAQVAHWRLWIKQYPGVFRNALTSLVNEQDSAQCFTDHEKASTELIDPRTPLDQAYRVVVGRRKSKDRRDLQLLSTLRTGDLDVVSYDRLLTPQNPDNY